MSESKKRILLMVLDGAGDRACPELRGLTPLQHIRTPNLDWFVEHGMAGLCDPISPGVRAGSDTAHLSILGYDARAVYTGRGPFEAIGAGVDIQPGDQLIIHRGAVLGRTAPDIRAFAADPNYYFEPFGAIMPGLAHQEIRLLQQEIAKGGTT